MTNDEAEKHVEAKVIELLKIIDAKIELASARNESCASMVWPATYHTIIEVSRQKLDQEIEIQKRVIARLHEAGFGISITNTVSNFILRVHFD